MNWWPAFVQLGISAIIVVAILLNPVFDIDDEPVQVLGASVENVSGEPSPDDAVDAPAPVERQGDETVPTTEPTPKPTATSLPDTGEPILLLGSCVDDLNDVLLEGQPSTRPGTDLAQVDLVVTESRVTVVFALGGPVTSVSRGPTDIGEWSVSVQSASGSFTMRALVEATAVAGESRLITEVIDSDGERLDARPGAAVEDVSLELWMSTFDVGGLEPPISFQATSSSGAIAKFTDACSGSNGVPIALKEP